MPIQKMNSLQDFFAQEIEFIYDGEKQVIELFPFFKNSTSSRPLREFLRRYEEDKKRQMDRLELLLKILSDTSAGELNTEIQYLFNLCKARLHQNDGYKLKDVTIAVYTRAINSSLLNSYQTALDCATKLNLWEADSLLSRNLFTEKKMEYQLKQLQKEMIEDLAYVPSTQLLKRSHEKKQRQRNIRSYRNRTRRLEDLPS